MAIHYQQLKNRVFEPVRQHYTQRDTMLYALSLGVGNHPLDTTNLPLVYEGMDQPLQALPTMSSVLGYPGFWMKQEDSGIDWVRLVHGEQRTTIHQPVPVQAKVVGKTRVTRIIDKGPGKGAIVVSERSLEGEDGTLYATLEQVTFCRGDGGYSQELGGQPSDESLPALAATPDTAPRWTFEHRIRPEAALLYRLMGDYNPLHADPRVAQAAGFEKPILHGLATYGMVGHALVMTACGGDASQLRSIHARFSSPVYPGETLRTEIWQSGKSLQFRALVVERNIVVLSHGNGSVA
ncbi:acyl dehydratase [Comamonas odontotermitis]|uniref:Acyl dehydratase n=1 Tax=Comamonas odontotermitis TaxID=379895 RepID=A0ABR6RBQ1_9BURK|nr:MaoC/PaaZ C-terminal domain-containing protein [Comamonas odontotermitis]MBB6576561.1 acyl dehydratase [Comamonas odontotermitis]